MLLAFPATRAACRALPLFVVTSSAVVLLGACGGHDDTSPAASRVVRLSCDDSLKTAFSPDAFTTVTLVKAFRKGDDLSLGNKPSGKIAENDLCLVKLNVGPGNPGPAGAPSTSVGIGVEAWLPSAENWNQRIHTVGGGGFVGTPGISSLTAVGSIQAATIAATEGSVSAATDAGHTSDGANDGALDGSFGLNPDASINTALWNDFTGRAIHEMTEKVKALAAGFYGKSQRYSYFDGCSTGGRQANEEAQVFPNDYDGILGGDAAINFSNVSTYQLYPQIVMQRDLDGMTLSESQLALVSSAAVSACDANLNGQHDGFVSDPAACQYDPTLDKAVLCPADGGANPTPSCVSKVQATAINKMWYGQTIDGTVPSPAVSNGYGHQLDQDQLWFGLARGTSLGNATIGVALADSGPSGPVPFPIGTDWAATVAQSPTLSTAAFHNAMGNGKNGWMFLSYREFANIATRGKTLQPQFANVDTNDPNLSAFRAHGGKFIAYHGMADQIIPAAGTNNYYERVASTMGGYSSIKTFYEYFPIPGMGHCATIGSVNGIQGTSPKANPPLPGPNQFFTALIDWVEKGVAPDNNLVLKTADGNVSRPLCAYPAKITYTGGNRSSASSYICK